LKVKKAVPIDIPDALPILVPRGYCRANAPLPPTK
jgi:hypothetical protein